jgi:hypothetical protein
VADGDSGIRGASASRVGDPMSFDSTIRTSVVYRSGMEPPPASIGSPVGLWWWSSENMLGELNESYDNL